MSNAYQNSRTLRRLAADHGALHSQPLPPNYLFPTTGSGSDNLTELDILLAGPAHTPFAAGVFKLHLTVPPTYPQVPPTAHFRTPIFHPNVDPQTGAVCVETLKRDWDTKLTLRDILIVIGCLLIQPNPDSALNAEAGGLIQEDYNAFARRVTLMTSIHAVVPLDLKAAVKEAQNRGQETAQGEQDERIERKDFAEEPAAPPRRRRLGVTARQRATAPSRRSEGSPTGAPARRRRPAETTEPLVLPVCNDDVFGSARHSPQQLGSGKQRVDDDSMTDTDQNQENDETKSPAKAPTPRVTTPRRPKGSAVPLGELTMDDPASEDSSDGEQEYPPSPRKSPKKSPKKQPQLHWSDEARPESSRDAMRRAPNITPPMNLFNKPLAVESPFSFTSSPRKTQQRPLTPARPGSSGKGLFGFATPQDDRSVFKTKSPSSSEKKRIEERRKAELNAKLWKLCDGDIERWNRGDFDREPFKLKAGRW